MHGDTEGDLLGERAAITLALRDCWYEEEMHALQRRYREIEHRLAVRRQGLGLDIEATV